MCPLTCINQLYWPHFPSARHSDCLFTIRGECLGCSIAHLHLHLNNETISQVTRVGTAAQYCYERSPIISCVGGRQDAGKYKQAVLTGTGCLQSAYTVSTGREIGHSLHAPRIITDEDISWRRRGEGIRGNRDEGGRGLEMYTEGKRFIYENWLKACDRGIKGYISFITN